MVARSSSHFPFVLLNYRENKLAGASHLASISLFFFLLSLWTPLISDLSWGHGGWTAWEVHSNLLPTLAWWPGSKQSGGLHWGSTAECKMCMGSTSFFKTCFNGPSALSVFVFLLSDTILLYPQKYRWCACLWLIKELETRYVLNLAWMLYDQELGFFLSHMPFHREGGWVWLFYLLSQLHLSTQACNLKRCMDAHPNMRTYPDIG